MFQQEKYHEIKKKLQHNSPTLNSQDQIKKKDMDTKKICEINYLHSHIVKY